MMSSFSTNCSSAAAGNSVPEPQTDMDMLEDLIRIVDERNWYQHKSDLELREQYICELDSAVQAWVDNEAIRVFSKVHGKHTEHSKGYGAFIKPFGGQAIDVVSTESDIDALCLLPNFIERSRIFESLGEFLQEHCNIQDMRKVENAFVPVISFQYKGIKIDLSYSILRKRNLSRDLDLISNDILRGLDESSVRSLSGIRDAELLLCLVPDADYFRSVLKVVKAWAKSKGIHNSAMGYPGGIAWAVIVAHTCQLYPHASVTDLVHKVFIVFSQWHWPKPVMLRPLEHNELQLDQFDPSKSKNVMVILTPGYPERNSAFTVSTSSLNVIRSQLQETCTLCEKIRCGEKSWETLFEPIDFFNMYKHFIMVTSHAASSQEHLDWSGFLESQVRKFVSALESVEEIKKLHLYTKTYVNRKSYTSRWFVGIKLQKKDGKFQSFDIAPVVKLFRESVNEMAKERQMFSETTKIDFQHIRKKQLDDVLSSMDTA